MNPVLLADGRRADRVFGQIIVEAGHRVLLMRNEHLPMIEKIRTGFAPQRMRQHLLALLVDCAKDRETKSPFFGKRAWP